MSITIQVIIISHLIGPISLPILALKKDAGVGMVDNIDGKRHYTKNPRTYAGYNTRAKSDIFDMFEQQWMSNQIIPAIAD